MSSSINEKMEVAVSCYAKTFDKSMSYRKAGFSEEEITIVEADSDFQSRMETFLFDQREKIIDKLIKHMDSLDEKISYKATMEMAMVLHPEFFNIGQRKKKDFLDLSESKILKKALEGEDQVLDIGTAGGPISIHIHAVSGNGNGNGNGKSKE